MRVNQASEMLDDRSAIVGQPGSTRSKEHWTCAAGLHMWSIAKLPLQALDRDIGL
jgi:hypothetical protein